MYFYIFREFSFRLLIFLTVLLCKYIRMAWSLCIFYSLYYVYSLLKITVLSCLHKSYDLQFFLIIVSETLNTSEEKYWIFKASPRAPCSQYLYFQYDFNLTKVMQLKVAHGVVWTIKRFIWNWIQIYFNFICNLRTYIFNVFKRLKT